MSGEPSLTGPLLKEALADPRHLPEHLALFAVRHLGPVARRTVGGHPDGPPEEAAAAAARAEVIRRGRRATVTEGAFVGGPFLLFVPVAFCAALLRQARTVLELAALDGRVPTHRDRAAELLVLQGVYDDVSDARAGLAALHRPKPSGSLWRPAAVWSLTLRMARLLGLLTPAEDTGHSRWAQAARWLPVLAVFLVGLVAPLVWLPYMAVNYDRATARLSRRAVRFYFAEEPVTGRTGRRIDPAALAGAGRALSSVLLPVVLIIGVLVTDLRFTDGVGPTLAVVLTAASLAVGAVWQWRRRKRRRAARPADQA